jgi:hypothetical protein
MTAILLSGDSKKNVVGTLYQRHFADGKIIAGHYCQLNYFDECDSAGNALTV